MLIEKVSEYFFKQKLFMSLLKSLFVRLILTN